MHRGETVQGRERGKIQLRERADSSKKAFRCSDMSKRRPQERLRKSKVGVSISGVGSCRGSAELDQTRVLTELVYITPAG